MFPHRFILTLTFRPWQRSRSPRHHGAQGHVDRLPRHRVRRPVDHQSHVTDAFPSHHPRGASPLPPLSRSVLKGIPHQGWERGLVTPSLPRHFVTNPAVLR